MTVEPIDEGVDHLRGAPNGRVILEYGDYECPYSRRAFREIERVQRQLPDTVRFAFRHFPLTEVHPYAASAAAAAEAAAAQGTFWGMHELLFAHQSTLEDEHLREYARRLALDVDRFDGERAGDPVRRRVARDVAGGNASGQVVATPTLFIDGVLYEGPYDAHTLIAVVTS
jgi:protein-disulfide isomerase